MSDETITACPHCDKSSIRYRPSRDNWYCTRCNRVFDEPVRRAPKHTPTAGAMAEYGDLNKSDLELFNDG